jgi:hypothetical protein
LFASELFVYTLKNISAIKLHVEILLYVTASTPSRRINVHIFSDNLYKVRHVSKIQVCSSRKCCNKHKFS